MPPKDAEAGGELPQAIIAQAEAAIAGNAADPPKKSSRRAHDVDTSQYSSSTTRQQSYLQVP